MFRSSEKASLQELLYSCHNKLMTIFLLMPSWHILFILAVFFCNKLHFKSTQAGLDVYGSLCKYFQYAMRKTHAEIGRGNSFLLSHFDTDNNNQFLTYNNFGSKLFGRRSQTILWVYGMALGNPVVPDEKRMAAKSFFTSIGPISG